MASAKEEDQITITTTTDAINSNPSKVERPVRIPTFKRLFFYTLLIKICSIFWTLIDIYAIASHYVDDDYDNVYAIRWERFKSIHIPKYATILILELISVMFGVTAYIHDNRRYLAINISASVVTLIIEIGSMIIWSVIRGYIKIIDSVFIFIAYKYYQKLTLDANGTIDAARDASTKSEVTHHDTPF